jgi:hypothetical protein
VTVLIDNRDMEHQQTTGSSKANLQAMPALAVKPALDMHSLTHPFLQLQKLIGNHALGSFLQTKLKVSQPGDQYEQEADRVAEQVMRMPDPAHSESNNLTKPSSAPSHLQRACAKCEEEDEEKGAIQRKAADESDELTLQAKGRVGSPVKDTPPVAAQIDHLSNGGTTSVTCGFTLTRERQSRRVQLMP